VRRILAVLAVAGCGHAAPPERSAVEQLFSDDPVAQLGGLEQRVLAADSVTIHAIVETRGGPDVTGEFDGTTTIRRRGESAIALRGTVRAGSVKGAWSSKKPVDPDHRDVQPDDWANAIGLAAIRMGLSHDWVDVVEQGDPDTGNGDMDSYVTVEGVAWKHGDAGTHTLVFTFTIGGMVSGDAQLTLDDRGLPAKRRVVVHFPEGDARVVEYYLSFDLSK
jgi:hypothetical protein